MVTQNESKLAWSSSDCAPAVIVTLYQSPQDPSPWNVPHNPVRDSDRTIWRNIALGKSKASFALVCLHHVGSTSHPIKSYLSPM
jgi:hypothetical protein